jgi:hypothetical protein
MAMTRHAWVVAVGRPQEASTDQLLEIPTAPTIHAGFTRQRSWLLAAGDEEWRSEPEQGRPSPGHQR